MGKLHDEHASRFQHDVWFSLADQKYDLTNDEKLLFLYLTHNKDMQNTGLYEINTMQIALVLGYSLQYVEQCIKKLRNADLLIMDKNLVYIPHIGEEQLFSNHQDRYWIQKVKRALKYGTYPSEHGTGNTNIAFNAWRQSHMEIRSEYFILEGDKKQKETVLSEMSEVGEN